MQEKLDLSGADIRIKLLMRKLGINTVAEFLALTEDQLLFFKNIGVKTVANILRLQAQHGKDITPPQLTAIDEVIEINTRYNNRLIAVAITANDLIERTKQSDRWHFIVPKKRVNALRKSLEALRK